MVNRYRDERGRFTAVVIMPKAGLLTPNEARAVAGQTPSIDVEYLQQKEIEDRDDYVAVRQFWPESKPSLWQRFISWMTS